MASPERSREGAQDAIGPMRQIIAAPELARPLSSRRGALEMRFFCIKSLSARAKSTRDLDRTVTHVCVRCRSPPHMQGCAGLLARRHGPLSRTSHAGPGAGETADLVSFLDYLKNNNPRSSMRTRLVRRCGFESHRGPSLSDCDIATDIASNPSRDASVGRARWRPQCDDGREEVLINI